MITTQVGQIAALSSLIAAKANAASNTAVTITVAGVANHRHVLHGVQWSYIGGTPVGALAVTTPAVFDEDIVAAGPGGHTLVIASVAGGDLVVTLAAGGVGLVGKLNIQYRTVSA
jgi:hypothetical protein